LGDTDTLVALEKLGKVAANAMAETTVTLAVNQDLVVPRRRQEGNKIEKVVLTVLTLELWVERSFCVEENLPRTRCLKQLAWNFPTQVLQWFLM